MFPFLASVSPVKIRIVGGKSQLVSLVLAGRGAIVSLSLQEIARRANWKTTPISLANWLVANHFNPAYTHTLMLSFHLFQAHLSELWID